MRSVHLAFVAIAVVAAGIVLGSGVAGYATFPGNDTCLPDGLEPEYRVVPFGARCVTEAGTTVEAYGPGTGAWIGWMVALAGLAALAVRARGNPWLAGALSAAVMLTVLGVASHGGTDFSFTMVAGMFLGGPLAFVTLHLLLPADRRSRLTSICLATLLSFVVFFVATAFAFSGGAWGHLGMALGLALGAAIGGFRPQLTPPRWLVGDQVA